MLGLAQQLLRAVVRAARDRLGGFFLLGQHGRIVGAESSELGEQGFVPVRDLPQRGIELLGRNGLRVEDPQEVRDGRLGHAELPAQALDLVRAEGGDRLLDLCRAHAVNDVAAGDVTARLDVAAGADAGRLPAGPVGRIDIGEDR